MIEVAIIINNYLHDLATAMLFSTGFIVYVLYRTLRKNTNPERIRFFREIYEMYTLSAKISLIWILAGGVPRIMFFTRIEWTVALDNRIIPALIVKHIILFSLVTAGCVLWIKLDRWVKRLPNC